jgi:hypothetical protein
MAVNFGVRLRASFTVENAVIIPLFVIMLVSAAMLDFYLHDTIVVKCIAQNVALAVELDRENGKEPDLSDYETRAVGNIRMKSIAQRAPGTRIESADSSVHVKSHGNNPALMLRILRKNVTSAESTVNVSCPDDFIRKVNAARELLGG